MEDEKPSIAISISQEGAEATQVLVVGDMQQVPEHPLATLQPPETAAEVDAASVQERWQLQKKRQQLQEREQQLLMRRL